MIRTLFFTAALFATQFCQAQLLDPNQPEQQACNAIVLCGDSFTSPFSYQGEGLTNELPSTPCGGGENESMWIRLNVTTGGSIVFTLSPLSVNDDYDFAVVDITTTGCENLSSANVVACNFNNNNPGSNVNGVIGINSTSTMPFVASGSFGNSFCQQIDAAAGDEYLIMISNFGDYVTGGISSGFTIDFTGSTAVFNEPPAPELEQILPQCDVSESVTIQLNDNITCASIATNGSDFTISPSGSITSVEGVNCTGATGYTNRVTLNFGSPLPNNDYTIIAQTGSDGNTLLGLCGAELELPDQLNFHVGIDPVQFASIDSPACQILTVHLNTAVACNTIAPNGSDFILVGPSTVPITSAVGTDCGNGFTQAVAITLATPIAVDGLYKIRAQLGQDGTTLADTCGRILPINAEIPFYVKSFNGLLSALPDSTICNINSMVDLYAINNGPVPPSGFNYQWSPASGVTNPNVLNTQAIIQTPIAHYVLSTIDANGCYLRDSVTIKVVPLNAGLNPTTAELCIGDGVILEASGAESYNWYDNSYFTGTPADLSCSSCPNPVASPEDGGSHTFYVIATSSAGCKDTLTAQVLVHPKPEVQVLPADTVIKYGESVTLYATGAQDYFWTPSGSLTSAYGPEPMATPLKPTDYVVTGTNQFGCPDTAIARVDIDYTNPRLIPSAFTPNGDGLNDEFKIVHLQFEKVLAFQIYNRYGQLVFETTNATEGWDGTIKGSPAAADAYYYFIQLGFPDDRTEIYKGDLTLIR